MKERSFVQSTLAAGLLAALPRSLVATPQAPALEQVHASARTSRICPVEAFAMRAMPSASCVELGLAREVQLGLRFIF